MTYKIITTDEFGRVTDHGPDYALMLSHVAEMRSAIGAINFTVENAVLMTAIVNLRALLKERQK